jgi:hypothetical protein
MQMKTRYFIAALTTMALASCKQELMPQESSNAQEVAAPGATAQTPTQQTAQVTPQPQQAAAQQVMQPAQAPAKVAKGMNPPHGQPGHRCDIAVGAPLNSAPAKAAPTTTAPGAAITKQINPTALSSTPTAPGMNPPHGQPGHRCEIAVGAPLSSAPAATGVPATLAAPAVTPAPTETKTQ